MAQNQKTPPLILQLAPQRLQERLGYLRDALHADRLQAMRSDRFSAITTMVCSLIPKIYLADGGTFCRPRYGKKDKFLPLTVGEIAAAAGLHPRRVFRCLADMKEAGLIESPRQIVRPAGKGILRVSVVNRSFTKKFWDLLGLFEQFVHDAAYIAKHTAVTIMPYLVEITTGKRKKEKPAAQEILPVPSCFSEEEWKDIVRQTKEVAARHRAAGNFEGAENLLKGITRYALS